MDSKGLRLIKEAYGGIYINQEEEIISESDCGCDEKGKKDKKKEEETVAEEQLDEMVPGLEEPVKKALDAGAKFMNTNPVGKVIKNVLKPVGSGRGTATSVQGANRMRQAGVGQSERPTGLNNSADLFDIVKGHLMSEGYADTEEAALAIMTNMSEEWRQSIVEQYTVNVADVKGGTQAAKNAQAGMKNKVTGEPLYKPGKGVGPDFKLLKDV